MPFFEFALQLTAWLICAPLAILLGIFILEVTAGLVGMRRTGASHGTPPTVIIVPAHNEAGGLAASLIALKQAVPPDVRILMVADNCSDDTAALARAAQVNVIERHDPANRGKGYALAFARDHLAADPPECVIVLDADCIPDVGSVDILRNAVVRHRVPVQATNLLRADLAAPPMVQISNFAFLVKNLFRQRGAGRIGHVALLGGTGMAMPWDLFATAPLASSNIVEDLALGIHAINVGRPPCFAEAARVESAAAEQDSALTQRTRWEHGFVQTAVKHAMPLLLAGIRKRSLPHFWMGCHLSVPPLSMLIALSGVGAVALVALGALTHRWVPTVVISSLLAVTMVLVVAVWIMAGRRYLSGASAVRLPFYVLWKLPVYFKLVGRRETEWRRTKRSGEA